ncbi:MAG: DNA polymerase III subunit gamma/tau [Bdellovibrionales bacterium]
MSYQVIARKWRPQSFTDLKGQSPIRRTLMNAIKTDRLHHALLFTGPRGTGKTSTARIVAKILRCTNLKEDQSPCDVCEDCVEISAGRSLDVLEIDGASNNGVDSIRELRDQVNFNPSSGTKKIYIIDEVHMLSGSAFNALLKTLEEPPSGVYFIMATTEAHKLPKTILSRCQRYDFKPVSFTEVIQLLKTICEAEKVEFEEDALFLIAQMGEGSVRDSLSFLDQCITFAGGKLTKDSVVENLGVTDIGHFKGVLETLIGRDSARLVEEIKNIKSFNIEPQAYLEELVIHIKNLILFKVDGGNLQKSEDYSEAEKNIYSELAPSSGLEDLYILFDICFKGTTQLVRSFNPSVLLEMTLLKAGTAPYYNDLLGSGVPVVTQQPAKTPNQVVATAKPTPQYKQTTQPVSAPMPQAPRPEPQKVTSQEKPSGWKGFVATLKMEVPVIGAKLELCQYSYDQGSKTLSLAVDAKNAFLEEQVSGKDFLALVEKHLVSLWGPGHTVKYGMGESEDVELKPSVQAVQKKNHDEKLEKIKKNVENHSVIKAMQSKYKVEIKEIKESK